jgi:hypothetical protein
VEPRPLAGGYRPAMVRPSGNEAPRRTPPAVPEEHPMTCPECNPEPATSPVVRCRQCGRSECRHDASHHAPQSYDMHTRMECMSCRITENRRLDEKRWADLTTADGHDPVAHWRARPCPACGSAERDQKMHALICADCRIVLVQQSTQPVLPARDLLGGQS